MHRLITKNLPHFFLLFAKKPLKFNYDFLFSSLCTQILKHAFYIYRKLLMVFSFVCFCCWASFFVFFYRSASFHFHLGMSARDWVQISVYMKVQCVCVCVWDFKFKVATLIIHFHSLIHGFGTICDDWMWHESWIGVMGKPATKCFTSTNRYGTIGNTVFFLSSFFDVCAMQLIFLFSTFTRTRCTFPTHFARYSVDKKKKHTTNENKEKLNK